MSQKEAVRRTNGKDSVKSQTDRISALPDDILSSIVSHFTVRDAAIVSVVSSRWKHLCASISRLEFDLNTMFGIFLNSNNEYNDNIHPCPGCIDRFVVGVNQFLQYYEGSQLVNFRVLLCLDRDSTTDIDQWVCFAVSRGVKNLYLSLSCSRNTCLGRSLYILRSEVLSHPNASKMDILYLNSCILGPDVMDRLSALKHLTLTQVVVGEEGLENILSCCLNLETVKFSVSSLPRKLCISGSLKQLKLLGVLSCSGVKKIELSATNLTSFEYSGLKIKFSFPRVPNLERVYFTAVEKKGLQYVFGQLSKDLPLLKNLSVYLNLNWMQHPPKEMAPFNNVKLLQLLCDPIVKLEIPWMIIVLKAFPLLEKFHLLINCAVQFEKGEHSEFGHKHLKEVHLSGFQCIAGYFEFAKYILEYAAALEKMVIDPRREFQIGDLTWNSSNYETWDKGKRRKVFELLKDHAKNAVIILK